MQSTTALFLASSITVSFLARFCCYCATIAYNNKLPISFIVLLIAKLFLSRFSCYFFYYFFVGVYFSYLPSVSYTQFLL